jgi:hypothetical protein
MAAFVAYVFSMMPGDDTAVLFLEHKTARHRRFEDAPVFIWREIQIDNQPARYLFSKVQNLIRTTLLPDEDLQVLLDQIIHQAEKCDQVGLPRAVWTDQDIQRTQFEIKVPDGLEPFDLHACQHAQHCRSSIHADGLAPDHGTQSLAWRTEFTTHHTAPEMNW